MTTVLIVDDSATARFLLRQSLEMDPSIKVIGEATGSEDALSLIASRRPDVVTMDVHLRNENGIDLTRLIMERCAVPIVIVTGADHQDPDLAFRALEAGALDLRGKLPHVSLPQYENKARQMIRTINEVAKIPVVTRRAKTKNRTVPLGDLSQVVLPAIGGEVALLAIGASTGGPPIIQTILRKIAAPCPLPIVVVQHIADGFVGGFGQWLTDTTGHKVEIIDRTTSMRSGVVYLSSEGRHIVQLSPDSLGISDAMPRNFHRPSIEVYFESLSKHLGRRAIAVLLTGMGADGGRALAGLKAVGAQVAVQRPESCVVGSMPSSALALDATIPQLAPDDMGQWLGGLAKLASKKI